MVTHRIALTLALAASIPAAAATPPARAQTPPPAAPLAYRLADTWAGAPWTLTPGRFGHAGDIGAAPDGTRFILDLNHNAVHVLAPDDTPLRVIVLPDRVNGRQWITIRLDVGPDGLLQVLSRSPAPFGPAASRVDVVDPDGNRRRSFEAPYGYGDIAVGQDGRTYLSSAGDTPRVDIFGADGARAASFGLGDLHTPRALDVAPDGTVYVVDRVPDTGAAPATPMPGPTATPEPSWRLEAVRSRAPSWRPGPYQPPTSTPTASPTTTGSPTSVGPPTPAATSTPTPIATVPPTPTPTAVEGVVVFDPDLDYRSTIPFNGAQDVAAGAEGVFVARDVEIFALGEAAPFFSLPYPSLRGLNQGGEPTHLTVAADGRLLASLWHCYFQGLVVFDDPAARRAAPRYAGAIDVPPLEGPVFPLRIAAGDGLAVLQGRFAIAGERPEQTYHPAPLAPDAEAQSVQRWAPDGRLTGQLGLCAGHPAARDVWRARDVAMDGADVYTLDSQFVQRRPDDLFPAWSLWGGDAAGPDEASYLAALSADADRVAILDSGLGRVVVADDQGARVASWPVDDPTPSPNPSDPGAAASQPVDIALAADTVFLADGGRRRIAVHEIDGTHRATWATHDTPARIAAGPDGDVFVLGRGGHAFRYTADGRLRAAWPMPVAATGPALDPHDIAVDDRGRVYVSFVRHAPILMPRGNWELAVTAAGIWVFEPAPPPQPSTPPPPPGGCWATPDKLAAPPEVVLGATIDVTLTVHGGCPESSPPAQIAIVFDTSRSMAWNDALERAREVVLDVLARLDPDRHAALLVTFDAAPALRAPLTRDLPAVARHVAALAAGGDTRLGDAIEQARAGLAPPPRTTPPRQVLLVVTDGGFKDRPEPAAAGARADGIDVFVLVARTSDFQGIRAMAGLTGDRLDRVFLDPDRWVAAELADAVGGFTPETGLFETIAVRDVVPANMRYVPDSAIPPAAFDPAARTLNWSLGPIPAADPIRLTYRLTPLEAGEWPTNVEATADYRDARGADGRLVFPVPRVRVIAPESWRIHLPLTSVGGLAPSDGRIQDKLAGGAGP